MSDIAAKLKEPPDSVRRSVVERWKVDKEEAAKDRKPGSGKARRW